MRDVISQTGDNYSNDVLSPKKYWFQISVKLVNWSNFLDTRLDYFAIIVFTLLCKLLLTKVTITSHIFVNIFQTVQFSAVIFNRCNEKSMSFLLIPKSQKVQKKKKKRRSLKQSDKLLREREKKFPHATPWLFLLYSAM